MGLLSVPTPAEAAELARAHREKTRDRAAVEWLKAIRIEMSYGSDTVSVDTYGEVTNLAAYLLVDTVLSGRGWLLLPLETYRATGLYGTDIMRVRLRWRPK